MVDKTRPERVCHLVCVFSHGEVSQHLPSGLVMSLSVSQLELTKPLEPIETSSAAGQKELVIRHRKGWIPVDWKELWSHRELLYFLAWRDVKVRYKQAVLGIAWAVLSPVMSVVVFSLLFGRHGVGTNKWLPGGLNTSLFIFAGLLPWNFISTAIGTGGLSLVNQQNLLSKIYMPRLFIPASTIGTGLVDMGIGWAIFFFWMAFSGYSPSPEVVLLPLLILWTALLAMGMAFILSAATVTYRDLRFLIPFIVQIGMWLSFAVIPYKSLIHDGAGSKLLLIELFNPFYGIVDAYRSCLFEGWGWQPWHLLSSAIWTALILVLGLFYFKRTERRFADIA
jgi:lipopolysaccharide transport system permease protein